MQGTDTNDAERKNFMKDEQNSKKDKDLQEDSIEAENDGWDIFTKTTTPDEAPNLHSYLSAKSIREAAKQSFLKALEECAHGLDETMINEMLQDSVVAVHQEQGERFEAHEVSIIDRMKSNHNRRNDMIKRMDAANTKWESKYKRLRGNVLLHEEDSRPNKDDVPGSVAVDEKISHSGDVTPSPSRSDRGDPDWDSMVEFQPSRDIVRAFLSARSNLQNSEETLSQALDEIHAGLKAEVNEIVQIVVDFHNEHETRCLELERDIESTIVENCKRRKALQSRLEESAKQAQGFFANLLSRLSQKV